MYFLLKYLSPLNTGIYVHPLFWHPCPSSFAECKYKAICCKVYGKSCPPPQTKPKQTSNSWHRRCRTDQVTYKTTEQRRPADLGEPVAKKTFNKDEDFKEGLKKNSLNIKVFKGYLEKKQMKLL